MNLDLISIAILAASGIYLSWSDIVRRRLPNAVTATIAVTGLAASLAMGGTDLLLSHALHFAVAIVAGFFLFALSVIGSGDAKYYAAAATWLPFDKAMPLLGWVSLAGFMLALAWLARARRTQGGTAPADDFAKVPFGVAIAAGSVCAAVASLP